MKNMLLHLISSIQHDVSTLASIASGSLLVPLILARIQFKLLALTTFVVLEHRIRPKSRMELHDDAQKSS